LLQDTLIRQFPHRRSPRDVLTGYVAAVLRVASFATPLRPALIKACVELLLMLDVEICIDDVQFSPSIQRRASNPPSRALGAPTRVATDDALQFDLDDPTSLGAAVAVAAGAASIRRHASVPAAAVEDASVRLVREAADKLDALMLIMFEDITANCADAGESDGDAARATRRGLLESFGVAVLSTNRSKFVQFLAFYCASLDASFATELLDVLLRKLADANEPALTRQCAAHYVGSLVSRARFVTPALRHSALVSLAAFAQAYIGGMSPSAQRPSAALHPVLYACVQAILYGVCFAYDDYSIAVAQAASIALGLDDGPRGDGASSEEGARWPLEEFQLEHILSHDTLPLKFCSPSVADEFARLAPSLGLPFVPHAAAQAARRRAARRRAVERHRAAAIFPV
jgi:RNA polymerase I-specific transcription initiation factor RRN3